MGVVMAKKSKTKKRRQELDSVYLLKLILYVIVGSQWMWLTNTAGTMEIGLPVGLAIGLWFASREHFQLDRKVEYALLLVATLVGFWARMGLYIQAF